MMLHHNNPPASVAFSMEIDELFAPANSITTIENDDQLATVEGLSADLRRARKDADAKRVEEKRPHMEAAKAVDDAWREPIRKADIAIAELRDRQTPYKTAKQAAKDEAAAKLRAEADARQKAAQDALRSDDLEARYQAEVELKSAGKLASVANRIEREATGLRISYRATITDRREALKHYLTEQPEVFERVIQELADKDARSPATRRAIPGVTFTEQKRAA